MTTPNNKKSKPFLVEKSGGHPNADLLLARIEQMLLKGQRIDRLQGALKRRALWEKLDAESQVRWADVAQMAGETETALEVLAAVNRNRPEQINAWERRIGLLSILGKREDLATALAGARAALGEEAAVRWSHIPVDAEAVSVDDVEQSSAAPFERRQERMAALHRYLAIFSGREDCFARQWADRKSGKHGYVPVKNALSPADLEDHLKGRKTYGIYLMHSDGRISVAAIDGDLKRNYRNDEITAQDRQRIRREASYLITRIKEMSAACGCRPLVEFSGGKGYHLWFFFKSPTAPGPVRETLGRFINTLAPDLSTFSLEVFPKQDRLGGKGFGNLIKLPLGIHRLTGKRSYLVECANRSVDAQLDYLTTVRYANAQKMTAAWGSNKGAEVLVHPRMKAWADAFPQLYRLQTLCPPLGQIMSLCMEGGRVSLREEKVLYQTIGFLPEGRRMLHHLLSQANDYNPHMVDFRLSRLRGTPLGCRRIHSIMDFTGEFCRFTAKGDYMHPLLHCEGWQDPAQPVAEKAENLSSALLRLQTAIQEVERFMK